VSSELAAVEVDAERASHAAEAALVAELSARLEKAERERDEHRKLYLWLLEENERLKRGLLGQKAERLPRNDGQLSLAILGLMLGEDGQPPAPPPDKPSRVREHERQKPKRRPLPEEWPRIRIDLVPPEVQREGLDAFEVIGEERRCVLERRPTSTVVVEIVRKKFVRKSERGNDTTSVLIADPLSLPISKGLAGPGLLADTIIKRWLEHQPLHRQEAAFARERLEIARSTLCGWHEAAAMTALPLIEAMRQDALRAPYLCVDSTGVLVMAPEKCRHGHFWVLVAPELHVLFEFTKRHDGKAVDEVLGGYKGYLVADARQPRQLPRVARLVACAVPPVTERADRVAG